MAPLDVRSAKMLRSGRKPCEQRGLELMNSERTRMCRIRESKEKDSDFGNDAVHDELDGKFRYSVSYLLSSDRI